MKSNSSRSVLRGLAGAYLLYLARQLLKGLSDSVGTPLPRWAAILVTVVFACVGVILLVNAWITWKKSRTDQDENPVEPEKDHLKS